MSIRFLGYDNSNCLCKHFAIHQCKHRIFSFYVFGQKDWRPNGENVLFLVSLLLLFCAVNPICFSIVILCSSLDWLQLMCNDGIACFIKGNNTADAPSIRFQSNNKLLFLWRPFQISKSLLGNLSWLWLSLLVGLRAMEWRERCQNISNFIDVLNWDEFLNGWINSMQSHEILERFGGSNTKLLEQGKIWGQLWKHHLFEFDLLSHQSKLVLLA